MQQLFNRLPTSVVLFFCALGLALLTCGVSGSASHHHPKPPKSSWVCPAGWFKAEPVGTDPARCYRRFNILTNGGGGKQGQYRSASELGSCANAGSRLATFSSYSEFYTAGLACNDSSDSSNAATYYEPGCWVDGATPSPTTSTKAWGWATPDISDTNTFLVGPERDNFWSPGEPSGHWWANHEYPEQCMQLLFNGRLNDYPCFGQLAAVCMQDATLA
jgi:hypothetical protein